MSWPDLVPIATVIGGFSTAIAAFAIVIGWLQIRASVSSARETEAQQTYNYYLQLCIQYPELSSSGLAKKFLKRTDFEGIDLDTNENDAKYSWFLGYCLHCGEKILQATGGRDGWKSAVEFQLRCHAEALSEVWPIWKSEYSDGYDKVVKAVINHA